MIIQLLVIVVILITAFVCSNCNIVSYREQEIVRKRYVIFLCFICILQSGLRHVAVGPDTYGYYIMFQDILTTSWNEIFRNFVDVYVNGIGKDAGYSFLEKVFQIFFPDYRTYLFFIAIFFFISFGQFVYKNTNNLRDVVFAFILYQALFYSFFSITGLRQTVAISLALLGFECIKTRKLIPFLFLMLLAAMMHKSALIFVPFYFVANIKFTKLMYTASIAVFPLLMIAKRNFAILLATLSSSEEYMAYAISTNKAGTYIFTLLILLLAVFGWLFMSATLKTYPQSYRFYNAMSLAILFTPLTWVDPNLMRVELYYSIFMIVFIPAIVNSICVEIKSIRTFIYISIILLLVLLIFKDREEYKFLWQHMLLEPHYGWFYI